MSPAPNTRVPGQSRIIAMLVDHISDPYFADIARRLDKKARMMGYKVVFGNTENDPRCTANLISAFENMDLAGYIINPPPGLDSDMRALQRSDRAVVLFEGGHPVRGVYNVLCDNYTGAYDAVSHLVSNDCRRIGLVTVCSGQRRMLDRRKGYETAIKDYGLTPCIEEISALAPPDEIKESIRLLFKRNNGLDALIFTDNNLAQDLLFSPAITAVAQPLDDMVEKILQCIIAHPSNPSIENIILPSRFIVWQSSLQTILLAS